MRDDSPWDAEGFKEHTDSPNRQQENKKKLECVQCALYNHHTLHISFFPTLTTQNPWRSCLEVTMYLMWMVVRIPVGNTTNLHYNFVVAKPLVHIILESVKNCLVY